METRTCLIIALLALLSGFLTSSADDGVGSENYCHDQSIWAEIDALRKAHPDDTLVIRTYAMRLGLCTLIDDGKISLETGIEIFMMERQRAIAERAQEEANRKRQKAVPTEEQEPLG